MRTQDLRGNGSSFASINWLLIYPPQVKEGLEDKKRHDQDHKVNNRLAEVLCPDGTSKGGASGGNSPTIEVPWRCLQPGMVVVVRDRCEFPADIVCIASADDEGKCYVETANIDGETNLKLRRCEPFYLFYFRLSLLVCKLTRNTLNGATNKRKMMYFVEKSFSLRLS